MRVRVCVGPLQTVVGSHLWSGSDDNNIIVWDVLRSSKPLKVLTGHLDSVLSLAHVTRENWKPEAFSMAPSPVQYSTAQCRSTIKRC